MLLEFGPSISTSHKTMNCYLDKCTLKSCCLILAFSLTSPSFSDVLDNFAIEISIRRFDQVSRIKNWPVARVFHDSRRSVVVYNTLSLCWDFEPLAKVSFQFRNKTSKFAIHIWHLCQKSVLFKKFCSVLILALRSRDPDHWQKD